MTNDPTKNSKDNLFNPRPELAASYREMLSRPVYASQEALQRQSEMAKPYNGDDYQPMEHYAPTDSVKPYTWDLQGPDPGKQVSEWSPVDLPAPKTNKDGLCILKCWDNFTITDCSRTYTCDLHKNGALVLIVFREVKYTKPGDDLNLFKVDVSLQDGPVQTCGGGVGSDQIVLSFPEGNPGTGTLRVEAIMSTIYCKDPLMSFGLNTCIADLRIECPGCDTSVALAFDDFDTSDTIAPNDSIPLYIVGTGSPFTWSVSGTGFTLNAATTSNNVNTLNAAADACGTATIQVTDCDDKTITFHITCTTGQWTALCGAYYMYSCGVGGVAHDFIFYHEGGSIKMSERWCDGTPCYGPPAGSGTYDCGGHTIPYACPPGEKYIRSRLSGWIWTC